MLSQLVLAALAFTSASAVPLAAPKPSPFTYGHAAYTYGPLHCVEDPCSVVPSCNKAHFAGAIGDWNTDTSISDASISQIYSYGGDVEFWPAKTDQQACWAPANPDTCNATTYYDSNNQLAAAEYANPRHHQKQLQHHSTPWRSTGSSRRSSRRRSPSSRPPRRRRASRNSPRTSRAACRPPSGRRSRTRRSSSARARTSGPAALGASRAAPSIRLWTRWSAARRRTSSR